MRKTHSIAALCAAWLALAAGAALAAPAAEIVSLQGKGDYRETESADWRPARIKLPLEAGQFVRTTQPHSKMALLLGDQTQMTLEGVSFAQVKSPDAGPRRSIIEFGQGKGRFQTKTPTKDFRVGTPTGLAAIRGTEWLVEVGADGTSAFTVVEGEIEISNDLGAISVGADEQGVLERGKPPSKRRLQDARERVQWVSSFTVDADRHSSPRVAEAAASIRAGEISRAREQLAVAIARGDAAPEAYFLAADIEMYFGRGREALALLERAAARFPGDARVPGLTARAALFADDFPRARAAAAEALAKHPGNLESQLAAGEVARLDGDSPAARRALREATRIAPSDWRAWHALGQVQSERSHPRAARRALAEADRLSANNSQVLSELGLNEANAYDLPRSRELLDRALAAKPDDFATWAALGYARLKSGDPAGALDALLRATLLEPRHARSHIHLGVAYWQLGRTDDALAQMRTASRHDPKDPLPYQFTAMMLSDLMRPGEALVAAREAVARLPYVKSLDPVANDLRGSANLGAPLAQMGLEAWAIKNAHDSFDPLWAGSHLFLADRLPGKYMATSELVQGFTTDPLAFGASNRFQSLVSRPGHYGTVALRASHGNDSTLAEPLVNVNGLFAEGTAAYFAEASYLRLWPEDDTSYARASSVTGGFGWKFRDDLGFFAYGNRFVPDVQAGQNNGLDPYERVDGSTRRFDVGAHYRPSPDWQAWLKGGYGSDDLFLRGRETAQVLFAQLIRETDAVFKQHRRDIGMRALRRNSAGLELYATLEAAELKYVDYLERDATARSSRSEPRNLESVQQDVRDESRSIALGGRWPVSPRLLFEGEVDYSTYDKTNDILVLRDYVGQRVDNQDDHSRDRWSPRVGAVVRPVNGLTLRAAWQEWLRPASIASLKPTSTAGIVLDDRYVLPGGRLEKGRVQVEWEALPTLLVTVFADRQEVENLYSSLAGVLNNRPETSNLERLRNRTFYPLASSHDLEGFPQMSAGELRESGLALNALATRHLALFAEGTWAKSENTGELYAGRLFPFTPRKRYSLGATWFSDTRWSLGAKATYRSERFSDEANLFPLIAEWSGSMQAYWESRDKRWSVEAMVLNIGAKSVDETVGIVLNLRF